MIALIALIIHLRNQRNQTNQWFGHSVKAALAIGADTGQEPKALQAYKRIARAAGNAQISHF
jgi:hypothetical protein